MESLSLFGGATTAVAASTFKRASCVIVSGAISRMCTTSAAVVASTMKFDAASRIIPFGSFPEATTIAEAREYFQ